MENRVAYVVIFLKSFFLRFFLLKSDLLWNHIVTQNVTINTFLPTHLKHQIDVLCDKMGVDVAPKASKGIFTVVYSI